MRLGVKLSLMVYGGFELRSGNHFTPVAFPTRKDEALFTYLALNRTPATRGMLCRLLWGDVPAGQARHSLRQALSEIRGTLRPYGKNFIQTTLDRVAINPNTVRVDVLIVERLLKRGSMEALRQACSLSRDELLAGIDVSEVEFERWLVAERIRLRQLAIEAHERYAAGLIARAENLSAIQTALRLVALDPLHEGGHRMLMTLYAKQGQVGAALQQYELCAGILARELDVEPAPETQQVRRDLVLHRTNFHAIAAQRSPGLNALLDAPERATESRIGQRSKRRAYPAR